MDDLSIAISDDELLEDVMSNRPPKKKDYKVGCLDLTCMTYESGQSVTISSGTLISFL